METTKCPRCGTELPDHVNVCTKCGKVFHIDRKRIDGTSRGKGCVVVLGAGISAAGGLIGAATTLVG